MADALSDRTSDIVKATIPVLEKGGTAVTNRMYQILFTNPDYNAPEALLVPRGNATALAATEPANPARIAPQRHGPTFCLSMIIASTVAQMARLVSCSPTTGPTCLPTRRGARRAS